jgi:hypothetical protein
MSESESVFTYKFYVSTQYYEEDGKLALRASTSLHSVNGQLTGSAFTK